MDERRRRDVLIAPRRLGLLEVHDVDHARRFPHALGEGAAKLPARPPQAVELPPQAGRRRLHVDDLDGKAGRRLAGLREVLPRGERPHVDSVRHQPAQETDCDAARSASLRQRRLGEDDEHAHLCVRQYGQ